MYVCMYVCMWFFLGVLAKPAERSSNMCAAQDGASSVYSETEVMDESLCIRSREDPYAMYDSYTPEADDYDMLTAPLLPAQQSLEELESKQKSALRSRIARGGSLSVMTHYRKVLAKMEGINIEQHGSVPPVFKIAETNRVRLPSSDSLSTAFASWDTESDCSTPGSVTMPLDHVWDLYVGSGGGRSPIAV